ncbi:MAG: hypothetical protein R3F11_16820 [Verrucomicrobiales bacterium]
MIPPRRSSRRSHPNAGGTRLAELARTGRLIAAHWCSLGSPPSPPPRWRSILRCPPPPTARSSWSPPGPACRLLLGAIFGIALLRYRSRLRRWEDGADAQGEGFRNTHLGVWRFLSFAAMLVFAAIAVLSIALLSSDW